MSAEPDHWAALDPQHDESQGLYRAIFEATSDGIAIWNLDGEVVQANPAICRMHGYSEAEFLALPVSAYIHPDYHDLRRTFVRRVRAGESYRIRSVDVRKDGSFFPVDVLGVPVTYRGGPHVVSVFRDISDQVEAEELLNQRVEERTRELSALLAISRAATSNLDLRTLVQTVLSHLGDLVEHDGASLATVDGHVLVEYLAESMSPTETAIRHDGRLNANVQGLRWERLARLETVIIPDTSDPDDELAREFMEGVRLRGIEDFPPYAWMGVPLATDDRFTGLLVLRHRQTGYYTEEHAALVRAVADQIALAVENARLFTETQANARDLSTLLELSQVVTSTLDLQQLYEIVLDRLGDLISYTGASIGVTTPDGPRLVAARRPEGIGDHFVKRREGWHQSRFMSEIAAGQAVLVSDVRGDEPLAVEYRDYLPGAIEASPVSYVRSLICVPLILKDRVIGELSVAHATPGYFEPRHVELVSSVAGHVSIAIENARLFAESERRASELAALLAISRAAAASLDLHAVVNTVLGHLGGLMEHDQASILTLEGDDLVEYVAVHPDGGGPIRRHSIHDNPLRWARFANQETLIVPDITAADGLASETRENMERSGEYAGKVPPMCWMGVPLAVERRIVGLLILYHHQAGYYTEQHASLAQVVADQIAVAIENARLFAESERRAGELSALLAISRAAAASLDLPAVVNTVLQHLGRLVEHDEAAILTIDGDAMVEYIESDTPAGEPVRRHFMHQNPLRWELISNLEPIIVADVTAADELAVETREEMLRTCENDEGVPPMCWMAVPLAIERRLVGLLVMNHHQPGYYTEQHASLAQAVADQVALAVENARLFGQAQHAASLEERQRLARELHDSVSQALYGIALGARTALRRAERSPQDVGEPLEYVLSLSEAALTEMRALIFELRPESLEAEGLVAALHRQAETMRARHSIAVDAGLGDEPPLSLAAREALYRIAQEALHNVVKHARASRVALSLDCSDGWVTLMVADDGAGFNPEGDFSGHLGLQSMRERAAAAGGSLELTATPGTGTRITVRVPAG